MKAVVLAGGKGTRLRPLTYAVPKPLLPVAERPMLEHIIYWLKDHGITDIIISIGYLGDQIRNYFRDGERLGVNISYIEEKEPLGTAGCLKLCENELGDTFVLVGGDNLTNLDLSGMIRYHKEHKPITTIALFELTHKVEYGIYDLDESNRVVGFREKPTFVYHGGTMIFVVEPEVFKYIPGDVLENPRVVNFTDHIIPKMLENGEKLIGFPFRDYWMDIGRLDEYVRINKEGLEIFGNNHNSRNNDIYDRI